MQATGTTQGIPFGRYRIRRRLGSGGMGEVFLADQLGPLGPVRPVALKRMRPSLAHDPQLARRFLQEMGIAARLNHPHIATTHDFGEVDGVYFMAMEYIEGASLDRVLAAGPLPVAPALLVARGVAEALTHAHERVPPVVHQDVSPANVMIGTGGQVKLLDFGIAATEAATQDQLRAKAPYAAPEQLLGHAPERRFDVWALGVVLYEMLAGRRPFPGPKATDVLAQVKRRSALPVEALNPTAVAVSPLIRRALDPNPGRRWRSAREFSEACTILLARRESSAEQTLITRLPAAEPAVALDHRSVAATGTAAKPGPSPGPADAADTHTADNDPGSAGQGPAPALRDKHGGEPAEPGSAGRGLTPALRDQHGGRPAEPGSAGRGLTTALRDQRGGEPAEPGSAGRGLTPALRDQHGGGSAGRGLTTAIRDQRGGGPAGQGPRPALRDQHGGRPAEPGSAGQGPRPALRDQRGGGSAEPRPAESGPAEPGPAESGPAGRASRQDGVAIERGNAPSAQRGASTRSMHGRHRGAILAVTGAGLAALIAVGLFPWGDSNLPVRPRSEARPATTATATASSATNRPPSGAAPAAATKRAPPPRPSVSPASASTVPPRATTPPRRAARPRARRPRPADRAPPPPRLQRAAPPLSNPRSDPARSMGMLSVRSEPWARVELDGLPLGEGIIAARPVPVGRHVLRLIPGEGGHAPRSLEVVITAGRVTKVFADFRNARFRIRPGE